MYGGKQLYVQSLHLLRGLAGCASDDTWYNGPQEVCARQGTVCWGSSAGMICNYVVFLELTHPSEVRTLVDVTVDPDGWAENAVTGKIPSQTLANAEGQALNRVSLIKADESYGSPSHENIHRSKTAYSDPTFRTLFLKEKKTKQILKLTLRHFT